MKYVNLLGLGFFYLINQKCPSAVSIYSFQFGSQVPEEGKTGLWYKTRNEFSILIPLLTISVNPFKMKNKCYFHTMYVESILLLLMVTYCVACQAGQISIFLAATQTPQGFIIADELISQINWPDIVFLTSRVSGRGYRIRALCVCLSVCQSVSTLTAELLS